MQKPRIVKRVAGTTKPSNVEIRGKIVEFLWFLKKQGLKDGTAKNQGRVLKRLIKNGVDIFDPETVKELLASKEEWKPGYKNIITNAYNNFLKMEGTTWVKPRYKPRDRYPFVPTEAEIDDLITGCGKKPSIFLHLLKETGADPGEAHKIRWNDINNRSSTITINYPVKGHNARIIEVSQNLIGRLQLLPKKSERVFNQQLGSMRSNFTRERKRIANKLANPRLEKISFTTFRHWKATTEYHKTKDILHVQKLLGHKNIQNTMIYIDLEKAVYGSGKNDEFICRVAESIEEAKELAKTGFDYLGKICSAELFRKRK